MRTNNRIRDGEGHEGGAPPTSPKTENFHASVHLSCQTPNSVASIFSFFDWLTLSKKATASPQHTKVEFT